MRMYYFYFLAFLLLSSASWANTSPAQLASVFNDTHQVEHYLVSEKYDGVRAIWDGTQLKTRRGNSIHAPVWFTEKLPNTYLDGELWVDYGQFEFVSGLARQLNGNDEDWLKVKYMIFDMPKVSGVFAERYKKYVHLVSVLKQPHIQAVQQQSFASRAQLDDYFDKVVARGGEGVMLHLATATHLAGRSPQLLKYKPYSDAEAVVIGYSEGKGKYQGKTGALIVRNLDDGIEFKVGSGLTDALRAKPPKIGTVITYRYQDKTKYNKPRFARFLRVREIF
ncbi:DNA ligase [Pseudoalteromonas phenolica]|uniref:DNA ligase n=1 Tax=Pseudoalteromonas phenolica TaxID=161398 RepID=UPI00110AFCA7|nr:DNA ligase [Pseudoalteromonas phenolica]